MRGGLREEGEVDEFGETMLLVLLCLVVFALWTRIVERMRHDQRPAGEQQEPARNGDGMVEEAMPYCLLLT